MNTYTLPFTLLIDLTLVDFTQYLYSKLAPVHRHHVPFLVWDFFTIVSVLGRRFIFYVNTKEFYHNYEMKNKMFMILNNW